MSEHGATLQTFNQELVKSLEELKQRRKELSHIIYHQQTQKETLEQQIKSLQDDLTIVNSKLNESNKLKSSYDQVINETEEGYKKILDTSQALLSAIQLESTRLSKTKKVYN